MQRILSASPRLWRAAAGAVAILALAGAARAGYPPGFTEKLGLDKGKAATGWAVHQLSASLPANVLYPGEEITFTYRFENRTDQAIAAAGQAELHRYRTDCDPLDGFSLWVAEAAAVATTPFKLDLPPKGVAEIVVRPTVPAACGGYALVLDVAGHGRALGSAFVRSPQPAAGRVQFPAYALDINPWRMVPEVFALWQRLGIKGTRTEWGASPLKDWQDPKRLDEHDRIVRGLWEHDITLMLTVSNGGLKQPLGRFRPWLNDQAEILDTKFDMAALPETDPEFRQWCAFIAARYGWPKGPVNAMELWNEPWEGISISGWGADLPRYRDIYTAMAQGVEDARREAGVKVLIGGACSSMNTEDKLFGDGTDTFLKWLDFSSIHYQPMCPWPALIPAWLERRGEYGPVRAWDTESWFANTEDRVMPAIATMRASGLERTAGVLHDAVYDVDEFTVKDADGADRRVRAAHVLAPAVGVAATQAFIGQRAFRQILFPDGLPWVFVFDGLPDPQTGAARPDDGTVVVVGDLGLCHERRLLARRNVLGLSARTKAAAAAAQLAALAADDPARRAATSALALAQVMDDGRMTLRADGAARLFDGLGNEIAKAGDTLTVPLDGLAYVLRTDGSQGSMDKLLAALRQADVRGYEPVEVKLHDFTARLDRQAALRVTLTNVLNRALKGELAVTVGGLTLGTPRQTLELPPHSARTIELPITAGAPSPANLYPAVVRFDAGADGAVTHEETLHVNLVTRRTVAIDGDLKDWEGVLPQTVAAEAGMERNLTEKAWLPFLPFEDKVAKGVATAYLAWDDAFFYFAAKIADDTPSGGGVRYETRDDSVYYYPEVCYEVQKDKDGKETKRTEYRWPEGVRRYTYRRNPDLPSGDGTDNVQIAFGVLPPGENGMVACPPGTFPGFVANKVTDYEYAFNRVGEKWGGGAEIWRLLAPGTPRKHFYPRQPQAARDGGPVKDGRLVMKHEGGTRIVEAAIPWSELPDVRARVAAGQSVRFTYRVNHDNQVAALELNANRSLSRINTYALHDLWSHSWEPQTEFVFEK